MAELVSNIYADALFETATSNNILEEIKSEINGLSDVLLQNPDYVKMLSSPIVSVEEKHTSAEATFGGRICDYMKNLIFLLIDNDRFSHFADINEAFNGLYDKHMNILRVTAITASQLSDTLLAKLSDKLSQLSQKNVVIINEVDEKVIGGILLRYDNVQVDATVQSKLDEIKKQIMEKTI